MNKVFPTLYKHTAKDGTQLWETWVEPEAKTGHGVIVTRFGLLDGKRQVLRETITRGKNIGRKNATTPFQQACAEAEARWNKMKDRKGYGLTVQQSAITRAASPMLAKVYEKMAKKVSWGDAFAQPKLDGFRCVARKVDGVVHLTSRENQPLDALVHIKDALEALPDGESLDGELYSHGLPLNSISSACKRRSDLTEKIRYHVYDVPMAAPFADRYKHAVELVLEAASEFVEHVKTVKVRNDADLMQCQRAFLEEGYEGAMLRHGQVGYQAGKRSEYLLKVKTFVDAEFVITDFKLGRGKYAGVPVFTCVTADGFDFDVLAPGDMEEKRKLGANAAKCVGRKLNVRYQYFTDTEAPVPFLPVATAFRD